MRKAKELLGKQIVNQSSGEQLATVRDLIFDADARRIVALLVDSGGWFRDARIVRWSSVVSVADVIMVQGATAVIVASDDPSLDELLKQEVRLSGIPIMSDAGERIGTVGDLYVNDQGEVIGYEIKQGFVSDLTGRKFLPTDHVQTIGRDAIIADTTDLTTVKQAKTDQANESERPDERTV